MEILKRNTVIEQIKKAASEAGPYLTEIRRELHQYPELGVDLPVTHEIISRELKKIPGLDVYEHKAGGFGIIALMRGEKPEG